MSPKPTRKEIREKKLDEFWVVLQVGGSSGECYGSVFMSEREAKKAVANHEKATFPATHLKVRMRDPVSLDQALDISEAMSDAAIELRRVQNRHSFACVAVQSA